MVGRVRFGDATVTRVPEWEFDVPTAMFAQTPPQAWDEQADLLVPSFYDPAVQRWRVVMQTWVIEVDGLTVLVDTGVGDGRDRPNMPVMADLETGFLAALAEAGFHPDDVDVVVNTHLHTDHVGWNTRSHDGRWVPTFPNARYVMPEADYRFFAPDGAGSTEAMGIVFADSILPVAEQTRLWADDLELSASLRLRPAPGHTPG
jgi:glyoxylase-like metal-dependent hydrolase (beta-lactamase superfamily II)